MTSLHHDRPVDDGRDVAPATPAATPAPARRNSRRQAGAVVGTVAPQVPQQRRGKASRTGVADRPASGRSTAKAATAAGSLAARAKAATTAAAGSTAARTAAAKATTARTVAAKAASAGATTARTAAARATTAARSATSTRTARPAPAATGAASRSATAAVPAERTAPAEQAGTPAKRPTPRPRPRPAAVPAEIAPLADSAAPEFAAPDVPVVTVPVVEVPVIEAVVVPLPAESPEDTAPSAAVVPAFVDEALAQLQSEPAQVALVVTGRRGRRGGRHRVPVVRRRSAFYLAAGLVGALSVGAFVDTDPAARADSPAVAETVSVAEQLGIEAQPTTALADAESTRLLQELVVSRNERDAASTAAADAQAAADFFAVAAAAEAARPKVAAPVNGARLTSGFGARWGTVHTGIDLAAPMRTPEHAVMDGVVLEAGPASGYGLAVYIQHDDGDVTVYGHMDEILVEPGEVVRAGDTIALLGNRGQSTGPHLHFEVHVGGLDGTKVDPLPWLRERGIQI